ncbi:MAG TPA: GtrA family protein [Usitatibacter sp.]|nr:GtrA family protein [Usitatibacter sp.]
MRIGAQFVRFLFVGALNTVFGYGVYAAAVLLGWGATVGLVLAYVIGVPFNYFTTGRLVFGRARGSFLRFVAAYVVIYAFNAALLAGAQALGAGPLLAQAACLPVVAVFSFLLFKLHVFRNTAAGIEEPR